MWQELGLTASFRVKMVTPGGWALVAGTRSVTVTLGALEACDQEFLFTALDGPRTLSNRIRGVLGQEFLGRVDYLLDFAHRRLVLGAAEPEAGVRVPLGSVDGRPALETSEGRLVLDSGTDTLILFHGGRSPEAGVIHTASGLAAVSTLCCRTVKIDGRSFRVSSVALVPEAVLEEDGSLPANVFHAIFVSHSGGYAIVNPAERR